MQASVFSFWAIALCEIGFSERRNFILIHFCRVPFQFSSKKEVIFEVSNCVPLPICHTLPLEQGILEVRPYGVDCGINKGCLQSQVWHPFHQKLIPEP